MTAGPLLLGIDAGTSRLRAILFDPSGRVVAEGSAPTPTTPVGPGQAEHDPEALWAAAVAAIKGALAGIDAPRRVRSVAVASMGEAGVLLDGRERPVGPALVWYDTRPEGELARLERRIGRERLHAITGLCPDPTFTLLKLLWLRASAPERFGAARAWLSVSGWIAWRLAGRRAVDLSLASRTLCLDLAIAGWSGEILGEVGIAPSLLGEIAPAGTALGCVLPEAAAATGLPADCVVGVGGHDHLCGLLALGADRPGVVLNSIGTAEALLVTAPAPSRSPALLAAGLNQGLIETDRRLSYVYGGLPTSSACIEWFRSLWPATDYGTLIAEAHSVPAGAHEAMFLPHLRIGSPPFPDPVGRGAFLGLSDGCGRGVLFRALLEGMALDAANQLRLMRDQVASGLEQVIAIGGGTRNALLMQLKASLYGLPVEVAEMAEGTCLGAALLGGLAAGLYPDLATARAGLAAERRPVAPDPAWSEAARRRRLDVYAAAYARTRELTLLLRGGA